VPNAQSQLCAYTPQKLVYEQSLTRFRRDCSRFFSETKWLSLNGTTISAAPFYRQD
jgi:hypothetical protein